LEEIKTNAIVLQTYNAKESDLVVVLLSPTKGKIRAFAKGAKNSKKRFFGNIEIFSKGDFVLTKKNANSDLYLIDNLENKVTPLELRNSLNHFLLVGLCFELVEKCFGDVEEDARMVYDNLNLLLSIADKLTSLEKLIPFIVFNLLMLAQVVGVDPTQNPKYFRQDDLNWLNNMVQTGKPLSYDPIEASLRALRTLANYLVSTMQLKVNSIESFEMIRI